MRLWSQVCRLIYTDPVTHRLLYTQTLLHADPVTLRPFYAQTLVHTGRFTRKHLYTQTVLHTNAFTHRLLCTQANLHTDAFTQGGFYSQTVSHTDHLHTQTHTHACDLLHPIPLNKKKVEQMHCYTQTLSHPDPVTYRSSYMFDAVRRPSSDMFTLVHHRRMNSTITEEWMRVHIQWQGTLTNDAVKHICICTRLRPNDRPHATVPRHPRPGCSQIPPKQLSTMMLQMTCVISFFHGISHEFHKNSSVPWCYKWHALSLFRMVFPMKFTKAAQYHDATNNTRYLIFSWYFPWNSPKQLSTMMLQITCVISFFSRYFPWKSPKQLSTMTLQMTRVISIFMVFPMKFTKTAQYHDARNDARYFIFHSISHEIH